MVEKHFPVPTMMSKTAWMQKQDRRPLRESWDPLPAAVGDVSGLAIKAGFRYQQRGWIWMRNAVLEVEAKAKR